MNFAGPVIICFLAMAYIGLLVNVFPEWLAVTLVIGPIGLFLGWLFWPTR